MLRAGHRGVELVSARGVAVRDAPLARRQAGACYLRLTPDEVELAQLMDGSRTLARLVAEFARISGRLAPDQVRRVVADLAGNRMLEELPVDAFAPLQRVRRRPWPIRLGRGLLAFVQGRRMVRGQRRPAGHASSTRPAGGCSSPAPSAALLGTVAVVGLVAFGWQWWTGEQSVFLTDDSYVAGAAVLLGLNIIALACHELGHALATKHAGRRVPAAGFLVYFGIPSVFVDTTDVWMAGPRGRGCSPPPPGPAPAWCSPAPPRWSGFAVPGGGAVVLQALLRLVHQRDVQPQPVPRAGRLLPADGLARGAQPAGPRAGLGGGAAAAAAAALVRRWTARAGWSRCTGCSPSAGWSSRSTSPTGCTSTGSAGSSPDCGAPGWAARVLLVAVVAALMSPLVYVLVRLARPRGAGAVRRAGAGAPRRARRTAPPGRAARVEPARPARGRRSPTSPPRSRWVHPRTGEQLVFAGAAQPDVFAVVDGRARGAGAGRPGRHGARAGRRRRRRRPRPGRHRRAVAAGLVRGRHDAARHARRRRSPPRSARSAAAPASAFGTTSEAEAALRRDAGAGRTLL